MTDQTHTVHQPLHLSLLDKLDPKYVAFHDKYMQYVPRDESNIWDGSARTAPSLPPGGLPLVPVGETRDIDLGGFSVRVFVPTAEPVKDGWPVFVWFHGGGWAIGGLNDSGDFLTRVCRDARCVVIAVAYRLSPEHTFPAPNHDALATLKWIYTQPLSSPTTSQHFVPFDLTKISIGGTSAGANLAIVLALNLLSDPTSFPHPLTSLILIVPVIDNTATAPEPDEDSTSIWHANRHAPWLTPTRMLWYRKMYMPSVSDWASWQASPNLVSPSLLEKLPKTWIAVSECDLLAPEALKFAEKLEGLGVEVETETVKGSTHSILALCGVLDKGRELVERAVGVVRTHHFSNHPPLRLNDLDLRFTGGHRHDLYPRALGRLVTAIPAFKSLTVDNFLDLIIVDPTCVTHHGSTLHSLALCSVRTFTEYGIVNASGTYCVDHQSYSALKIILTECPHLRQLGNALPRPHLGRLTDCDLSWNLSIDSGSHIPISETHGILDAIATAPKLHTLRILMTMRFEDFRFSQDPSDMTPAQAQSTKSMIQNSANHILSYLVQRGSKINVLAVSPLLGYFSTEPGVKDDNSHRYPYYYYVKTRVADVFWRVRLVAEPIKFVLEEFPECTILRS